MIFIHVGIALIVGRSSILSFSSLVRVGIGLSRDIVFISGAASKSETMWEQFSVGLGRSLGLGFRFEFDARRDRRSRCCRRCVVAFAIFPSPVLRLFNCLNQKMTSFLIPICSHDLTAHRMY